MNLERTWQRWANFLATKCVVLCRPWSFMTEMTRSRRSKFLQMDLASSFVRPKKNMFRNSFNPF